MLAIKHGVDIVDLSRPELKDFPFAKRFMTTNEYDVFLLINNVEEKKKYMAAIWSLKEAIIKATNHKYLFSYIDIKLSYFTNPICNIENVDLSLSYEEKWVLGSAIYILHGNNN